METVIVTQPMQWAATPDISEVPPISEADKDCLREVRDVLAKFGCLDRFGVNLIHKHFDMADDEALVETVDAASRTLTVRPMKKPLMKNSVETQWKLATGEAVLACEGYCSPGGGHRHGHSRI